MVPWIDSLRDLVAAWYRTDRIRLSPFIGRLLGLRPGNRFVFRCESFDVVTRTVRQTAAGHELVYEVASSLGDGSLVVIWNEATGTTIGELAVPTLKIAVFDSDILVMNESV